MFDSPLFHFCLELVYIADTREKVRLSISIAIKGSKPLVPLLLGCFCFLEVADHGELQAREKAIVDNLIVGPTVYRSTHVIVWLSNQLGTLVEFQRSRSLNVVKLKGILLKDAADTASLNPKKSREQKMEATSGDANQRRRPIRKVS